jgi:putative transposase
VNFLYANDIIKPVGEHPVLTGLHRVLHVNREADLAVIIPIRYQREEKKKKKRKNDTNKSQKKVHDSARYYWQGWSKRSLCALESVLNDERIVKVPALVLPPIVGMTDEEIQRRYPPRERDLKRKPTKRKDGRTQRPRRLPSKNSSGIPLSATLDTRELRLDAIAPVLDVIKESGSMIFETDEIGKRLFARCKANGIKPAFAYDALHRYLALGCGANALLGNLDACGGTGPREQEARLGRKLGLYDAGKIDDPGLFLSDVAKQRIQTGWRTHVAVEKLSRREAYFLTMGAFWSSGTQLYQGKESAILLPVHQRPSFAQFCYWGPRSDDGLTAWEAHLKPNEWEQKFRALLGTQTKAIPGICHTGMLDATRTNTTFISMFTRLNALGTGTRICIHDAFSDVIGAPYCGLEGASGNTALLAIYHATQSIVELAKRFGMDLTEDQIPPMFFRKYLTDNGELRTALTIAVMKALSSSIEFVESNRPERKGGVEAGHHSINSSLDDKIDGSTFGRQRERGEEATAIAACWTWFEYVGELLLAIAYHNTCADASALFAAHPCRVEMARDGVGKTRMDIYKWALKTNRNFAPAFDRNLLRARLLPSHRAVVRENGVFLLRPDRGRKLEYVKGPRFLGLRITQLQMIERVRRGERIELDVHLDPENLSRGWISDERGIHELVNVGADPILMREGTLADCLAHQDDERVRDLLSQAERDQSDHDYTQHRANRNAKNRKAKQEEIEAAEKAGGKVTKKRLKSGIAGHRAAEAAHLKDQFDPLSGGAANPGPNKEPPPQDTPPNSRPSTGAGAAPDSGVREESDVDIALRKFRAKGKDPTPKDRKAA